MAKGKKNIKRTFFEVNAPLTSSKIELYGESVEQLNGRVVKLDLTRSLKGKNFELKFKVIAAEGKLIAEPFSIEMLGSYMRRMIRRGTDYIEDSFIVSSKDSKVVIKPFMITRKRVSRSIRNDLRNETKKHLEAHIKTRNSRELFSEIMSNKIQKELSFKLKKIYPLALCEIRAFKVLSEKKSFDQSSEVNAEKKE